MPFPNHHGNVRYWTREKVVEGLKKAAKEIKGPLPCLDSKYNELKTGRLDWPPAHRIYEFFRSMARAWLNAGVSKHRVTFHNVPWDLVEDNYLLENAGRKSFEEIASYLRRTRDGVKDRLNRRMKIRARDNQGLFSAAELAKEFKCPYSRVLGLLAAGRIKGDYDDIRHRWQVDINQVTKEARQLLEAPKTKSYKDSPPDLGDYYERYGLRRKNIGGRVVVIGR
jgi:hypothetical protein